MSSRKARAMKVTRLLILDPEISFAVPIKQALEGTGRYRVNLFASSRAALELLAGEPQDFAVIDVSAEATGLIELIETLRRLYPKLTIIVSCRADQPPAFPPETDSLPSLVKPYLARQLDALIRAHMAQAASTAPAQRAQPDETFLRAIEGIANGSAALASAPAASEPAVPLDATLQAVISGTQPLERPPERVEPPQTLLAAQVALESAADDSVPLERLAEHLASEAERVPPEARPSWSAPNVEQTLSQALHETAQLARQSPRAAATPIAALALRFMQMSVDAAVKAAFLTRGSDVIALSSSSELDELTCSLALREIGRMWQGSANAPAVFRPLQVNPETLYLLYSTRTVDDLTLSLLFYGGTSMRTIRQVARQLHEAMSRVPESARPEASEETMTSEGAEASERAERVAQASEAEETLPSRPTDLRPPQGLQQAVEAAAEEPPLVFTLALLPSEPPIEGDLAALLPRYFAEAAAAQGWRAEGVEIQPTHVSLQVSVPPGVLPSAAAEQLNRATAARAGKAQLWLDVCYIITPARSLTQRELAEFVEYARLVQSGA
jgi:CheY-like chemotaxis protein